MRGAQRRWGWRVFGADYAVNTDLFDGTACRANQLIAQGNTLGCLRGVERRPEGATALQLDWAFALTGRYFCVLLTQGAALGYWLAAPVGRSHRSSIPPPSCPPPKGRYSNIPSFWEGYG